MILKQRDDEHNDYSSHSAAPNLKTSNQHISTPKSKQQGKNVPKKNPAIKLQKNRQQNSLLSLTKRFIQIIKYAQNKTVDLNRISSILKVQKRRIYDITNVLQGIGYVRKSQKNLVKWLEDDKPTSQQQRENQMKFLQELIQNIEEENQLDDQIQEAYEQLLEQYAQCGSYNGKQLLDSEDFLAISKRMQYDYPENYQMVVIGAPKGSTLFVDEQEDLTVLGVDANKPGKRSKGTIDFMVLDPRNNKVFKLTGQSKYRSMFSKI